MILLLSLFLMTSLSFSKDLSGPEKERAFKLAFKNHKPLSYSQVKKLLFSTVENEDGIVCSVYTPSQCAKRYYKQPPENFLKSSKYFKLNIEHTWPQSKGAKEMPANSDMHHLFVTSKESNTKRANLPFCNVDYPFWQKDGSAQGIDKSAQDCFEPQDKHKGNVARALFYFSIRYKMPIDQDQEIVLRQWHKDDPVDNKELYRNQVISKLQGNTNPFILDEKLVKKIANF